MNGMIIVIVWLLLLNCFTCSLGRIAHGGRLIVRQKAVDGPKEARPKLLLISGLKSQPDRAFSKIDFGDKYEQILLEFSPFGFNPQVASGQLDVLMTGENRGTVCAVSLGAKVVEYADIGRMPGAVLINPCSHPQALRKHYRYYPLFRHISPFLELASYALGWIAVLPIMTDDMGDKTSIALIIDQIFWIAHSDVEFTPTDKIGVIISTNDEMMDNPAILNLYRGAHFVEIDTPHGRIGSSRYAKIYERAIAELLDQISA